MSVKVMSWVWDLDLPSYPKFVLLKLGDCADDDGCNAFPAVDTVAHKCGLSGRTVQRILKEFTDSGVLEITGNEKGGRRRSRVYRLDREVAEALHGEKKGDTGSPFNDDGKGDNPDGKGDTDDRKGCQSLSPEPSLTVKGEQKEGDLKVSQERKPPDFESQFDDWWSLVPKKVGKGQARAKFRTALRKTDFHTLKAGIIRYARHMAGQDPAYIAHPATWLHGERWLDEVEPERKIDDAGQNYGHFGGRRHSAHAALFATGARAARDPDRRMSGEAGPVAEGTVPDDQGTARPGGPGSGLSRLPRPRGTA